MRSAKDPPPATFQEYAPRQPVVIRQRQQVPNGLAHFDIPWNGNMNPESSRFGKKQKTDICIACSGFSQRSMMARLWLQPNFSHQRCEHYTQRPNSLRMMLHGTEPLRRRS